MRFISSICMSALGPGVLQARKTQTTPSPPGCSAGGICAPASNLVKVGGRARARIRAGGTLGVRVEVRLRLRVRRISSLEPNRLVEGDHKAVRGARADSVHAVGQLQLVARAERARGVNSLLLGLHLDHLATEATDGLADTLQIPMWKQGPARFS